MNYKMLLSEDSRPLDSLRCIETMKVIERLSFKEGQVREKEEKNETSVVIILNELFKHGLLTVLENEDIEIFYVPSRKSKEAFYYANDNNDNKIFQKQKKRFKNMSGALFKFPIYKENAYIEAFITDWSPFAVASALAIHKYFAIQDMKIKEEDDYFTGKFVRHPLTGDLLPLWVASWVKPEFGTGAVVVNPAHSSMDLTFAQKIGLPIRFGLSEGDITCRSGTWAEPPIIKTGKTTQTGRFDGLSVDEATDIYFEELSKNGFAIRYENLFIGKIKIASGSRNVDGNYMFCKTNKQFLLKNQVNVNDDSSIIIDLQMSSFFKEVIEMVDDLRLICLNGDIESKLLFTELLYYDIYKKKLNVRQVYSIQRVEEGKISKDIKDIKLACLCGAPLNQVVVINDQLIFDVNQFIENHQLIVKSVMVIQTNLEKVYNKQVSLIKKQIEDTKYSDAFKNLCKVQKQIIKIMEDIDKSISEELVIGYFAATYILAGYCYPDNLNINLIWDKIS